MFLKQTRDLHRSVCVCMCVLPRACKLFTGLFARKPFHGCHSHPPLHAPLCAVNPTGCSLHLRAHEQELTKRHERELNDLSAAHSRDTQNMLSDFNKAQEVLKDKISALQIL